MGYMGYMGYMGSGSLPSVFSVAIVICIRPSPPLRASYFGFYTGFNFLG